MSETSVSIAEVTFLHVAHEFSKSKVVIGTAKDVSFESLFVCVNKAENSYPESRERLLSIFV